MNNAENIVAFAGVAGANSDLACREKHPYMETLPLPYFEDVFEAVEQGKAKYAMIPIENSQAGRVAEIHNILPKTKLHIIDEHILKVEHQLYGIKGAKLEQVKEVYSHPQALMQCRENLRKLGLHPIQHSDTAQAGLDIAKWNDPTKAAICSKLAGALYGLDLLKENIHDSENNRTLFITLSREAVDPDPKEGTVLTSLIIQLRHIPAALYKALGGFATNGVNLVKLESYVLSGVGYAQFFITIEGHPHDRNVQLALEELGFYCQKINVLGVYYADSKRGK